MQPKTKRLIGGALLLPVPVVTTVWWVKKRLRKEVNSLTTTHVDVQNCIDKCTQTAQKIRIVANDLVDHRARYALAEADRHIEMCIHGCLDAKSMARF